MIDRVCVILLVIEYSIPYILLAYKIKKLITVNTKMREDQRNNDG